MIDIESVCVCVCVCVCVALFAMRVETQHSRALTKQQNNTILWVLKNTFELIDSAIDMLCIHLTRIWVVNNEK